MAFKKKFLVSDETVNSYKFIVLTAGIKLDRAKTNCPCFYEHNRNELPLGHWENFVVENNKLFADLVIDGSSELEKTYIRKIENGDIKGATIGADIETWDFNGAVPILTQSDLFEISIAALPGNSNALALRKDGEIIKLSQDNIHTIIPQQKKEDMKQIALKLGLLEAATENEIVTAIASLQLSKQNGEAFQTAMLKDADKDLTEEHKEVFVELSKSSPAQALKFANANKVVAAVEVGKVVKDVKVSTLLKKGEATEAKDGKDCYDYLQKNNSVELTRIKNEEPEKYATLVKEYATGVRFKG